jgi:hypothetical protein
MLISIFNPQKLKYKHIFLDYDFEYVLISIYMLICLDLLRTTALVAGQASKSFEVHLDRVARATTKADVLKDLLKHARIVEEVPPQEPDMAAAQHVQQFAQ